MNLYIYMDIYIIWSLQQVNICILYTVHMKLSNNGTDSLSIVGTLHDENIERTTYHHFNSFQFHLIFVHNWIGWVQFQFLAVVHLIANRYLDCIARYALHAVPIFWIFWFVHSSNNKCYAFTQSNCSIHRLLLYRRLFPLHLLLLLWHCIQCLMFVVFNKFDLEVMNSHWLVLLLLLFNANLFQFMFIFFLHRAWIS